MFDFLKPFMSPQESAPLHKTQPTPKDTYDHLFKITLIGDSGAGKSCFLIRFADNTYTDSFISTIGVDFKNKNIRINDEIIKVQIWDSAGQERFRSISGNNYRGTHAFLFLFDITDLRSFQNVGKWLTETKKVSADDTQVMIIGTHSDLTSERKVSVEEAQALTRRLSAEYHLNINYIETSAKDGTNVNEAMGIITQQLLQAKKLKKQAEETARQEAELGIPASATPALKSPSIPPSSLPTPAPMTMPSEVTPLPVTSDRRDIDTIVSPETRDFLRIAAMTSSAPSPFSLQSPQASKPTLLASPPAKPRAGLGLEHTTVKSTTLHTVSPRKDQRPEKLSVAKPLPLSSRDEPGVASPQAALLTLGFIEPRTSSRHTPHGSEPRDDSSCHIL